MNTPGTEAIPGCNTLCLGGYAAQEQVVLRAMVKPLLLGVCKGQWEKATGQCSAGSSLLPAPPQVCESRLQTKAETLEILRDYK